jgi:folate-binding protein YgfZ
MTTLRLNDRHLQFGAQWTEVSGWEAPLHYGDPVAEHRAVRQAVGLADLSHRGRLRVTGDDRIKWLQSIVSNDLLPLKPGQGIYSSLLTHKGKMLTYFRLYLLPDSVLVEDVGEIGETTFQTLKKFLLYGTKAKMENLADTYGLLLASGPKVGELLKIAFNVDMTATTPPRLTMGDIVGQPSMFLRTEETGEVDVEILVPADLLAAAWDRLMTAGNPLGLRPFGTVAREALRMEAGLPKAGVDLTEEIVPPEANLEGKAFSLSKGCYPGQEVVARMDTYGSVRRHLVGLVLHEAVVPATGAKLFSGDREVGWVSSATTSPQLGQVIAFGYPLRDFSKPDTRLAIELDGRRVEATVRPLPFYQRT